MQLDSKQDKYCWNAAAFINIKEWVRKKIEKTANDWN